MAEIRDETKLYRIVKARYCPTGDINDLDANVFSGRKARALSFYLSAIDTPQEALDNYLEHTVTEGGISQIRGVVAVTAGVCRNFGVTPKLDGVPVPSHVKATWESNDNYKDMKETLLLQAIELGWQLGPLEYSEAL